VGDGGKKGRKQIIKKKQQSVSSDYRRKISSHLEKNHIGSFEFLKQVMEMVIEQTVCLEKRQITLKDIITAAILGHSKSSPGPVFCVPSGSLGKAKNKTSTHSTFPAVPHNTVPPNCFQFRGLPQLHIISACLITPSRFLVQVFVQTVV